MLAQAVLRNIGPVCFLQTSLSLVLIVMILGQYFPVWPSYLVSKKLIVSQGAEKSYLNVFLVKCLMAAKLELIKLLYINAVILQGF